MVYPHVKYLGPSASGRPDAKEADVTRELDSRMSDGIHIRLLWRPVDGQVSVAVNDTKTGEVFELPVGDRDRPLDVFHHPYAYAARRDLKDVRGGTPARQMSGSSALLGRR
jgi:hypothetical protein